MEKRKTSHVKRYYKHYLSVIFLVFLLIVVGSWLFVRHYKPILAERLKEQVYIASDSLYRVTFSDVHLNPILRKFTLDSFHLIPDTNTYNRLKLEHRAPANLFDIFVGKFKMKKLSIWPLIIYKKVNIGIIKAENPKVTVYHEYKPKEKNRALVRKALHNLIGGSLNSIQIDHLGLHNISLIYKNKLNPDAGNFKMTNMELVFRDIYIDSSTLRDSTRFLFAKDIWFHLDKSHFYTADSMYEITTNGIGFSLMEERAIIKDIHITPRLSEQEFDRHQTYRKNLFKLSIDSLLLEGLSLDELQKKRWSVKEISMRHSRVDIYLNSGLPVKPVKKPLLQDALRSIETDIMIDTLHLSNVDIKYRERNPASGRIGNVTFNNIHGSISNITNDTVQIKKNKLCKANLHTLFMGEGKLHALFVFNLADSTGVFSYKGHLGFLNATVLNPATLPLGLIRIKSGRIHSLDYNFKADKSGAYGSVGLRYDRLGVSVLSKNAGTGQLKKRGLVSLAANLLVLKNNNLYDSMAINRTQVQYPRDPYRSVFYLMWKSIFSGVKVIAGLDQKTAEQIQSLKEAGKKIKSNKKEKKKNQERTFIEKAQQFLKKTFDKEDSSQSR